MNANLKLLNEVQSKIIEVANQNGTSLKAEFGTVEEFKKFVVSFTIRAFMEIGGLTVNQAYDVVMGDGAYNELANSVWEQLNAA